MFKLLLTLVIMSVLVSCKEEDSSTPFYMVIGKIVKLSTDSYGIDGQSQTFDRIFPPKKNVKYRLSWLPQEVKDHVAVKPSTIYKYYYRITELGSDLDWSTTIAIITD